MKMNIVSSFLYGNLDVSFRFYVGTQVRIIVTHKHPLTHRPPYVLNSFKISDVRLINSKLEKSLHYTHRFLLQSEQELLPTRY